MKKFILLVCLIIFTFTIIIILKNAPFYNIERFATTAIFDKCLNAINDPCQSRNVIRDELFYLKDAISTSNLKYDRLTTMLAEMEDDISLIKGS